MSGTPTPYAKNRRTGKRCVAHVEYPPPRTAVNSARTMSAYPEILPLAYTQYSLYLFSITHL
jgi:hypothetical protein